MIDPSAVVDAANDFEPLRRHGLDAYDAFYALLTGPGVPETLTKSRSGEAAVSTIESLPEPHPALPLRVLASLAHHAASGSLEFHYLLSELPGYDAASELRRWREPSGGALQTLCPEAFGSHQLWLSWSPPVIEPFPAKVPAEWPRLASAADGLARAREVKSKLDHPNLLLFCLIRDWIFDLGPLLREMKIDPGTLLGRAGVAAFSETGSLAVSADVASMLTVAADTIDHHVPDAWTILLALRLSGGIGIGGNGTIVAGFSAEAVIAAIRRLTARADEPATVATPDETGFRPSTTISTDVWTADDQLGYRAYAEAIAEFIKDPRTRAPLTIGLKAPWGAGKTSLMRMVVEELAEPSAPQPPPADERQLTNGHLLELTTESPETAARQIERETTTSLPRGHATVWFNAWKYQSSDQLWAGLAHAIISQVEEEMTRVERERFWAALNLRRVDVGELRRRVHRAFLSRLTSYALIAPGIVLGVVAAALQSTILGSVVALGGAAGAAVDVGRRWRAFAQQDVATSVPDLVRDPGYGGKLGFLHLVHEDMRRILELVATPERPLVVFIDDLDRCSYSTVAQVIEALNAFLAGEFDDCIFVIAMEPDLVAAQIHVAYDKLFTHIETRQGMGGSSDLGWRFLEKMVQLPLALPAPDGPRVEGLIGSLIEPGAMQRARRLPAGDARLTEAKELLGARRRAAADAGEAPSLAGVHEAMEEVLSDVVGTDRALDAATVQRAARETYRDEFDDSHPEVRAILLEFSGFLVRNPREVKRFVNVFRFYAYMQFWRQTDGYAGPDLRGTAKLAALAVRGPDALTALGTMVDLGGRKRMLLAELEDAGRDDDAWVRAVEQLGDRKAIAALGCDGALRDLILAGPAVGELAAGFL